MKRHRRAALSVAAVAATFALALAGCTSSSTPPSSASTSLTMLEVEPTQGLDPNLAFADASRIPMAMMFDTLVERNSKGNIVGSLASTWKISADALTYVFTLRDDSAFSDGSPITASDVVFSLKRAQQGAVLGAQLKGVEISTDGDKQVKFTLTTPNSGFLTTLATPGSAAILSQKAVEKGGSSYFTKPTVTSGPWSLKEYIPKSDMTFIANPHYYNVPKVHTVNYTFTADPTSSAAAVESGSADIANVGYPDAANLKKHPVDGVQVVQSDQLDPLFWGWDRTKAPFDDERVRQAVAWAVDRQARINNCWYGTGAVTYGNILRPWDPAYAEINAYKASSRSVALDKAKKLLDEAGWVDNGSGTRVAKGVKGERDGAKFAITVPYESNWPAAACNTQLLQQNLAQIGISVTPDAYDPASYWGQVSKGAFTMYHGGAGAVDAADLYFNWFDSEGSLTALTTHLSDPAIDAQVAAARTATDPKKANATYHDLEVWQADYLPMLVVGYQWQQLALGSRVHGWTPSVDDGSRWLVGISVTG